MPLSNFDRKHRFLNGRLTRYGNRELDDRESSGKMWQKQGALSRFADASIVVCFLLSACETDLVQSLPMFSGRTSIGGIVAADEPQAVLIAREILDAGGSAADSAVALGFGLSVTLQSAAGLGGGGVCTVFNAENGRVEVLDFNSPPAIGRQASARWQVTVPSLARGLFALHAKYGRLPWQQVVVPSENLARFGNSISRAFALDLRTASAALVNDPDALNTFMSPRRMMLEEGERLRQIDLASVLGRIRGRTPGDFYVGALARTIDDSSLASGVSLNVDDLRQFEPRWVSPQVVEFNNANIYMPLSNSEQSTISLTLDSEDSIETMPQTTAPSSTGFVVADANGNAIACSLTMIQPFGVGLMLDGLGFLLAPSTASSAGSPPPLLPIIAVDRNSRQVIFVGATGGDGASEVIGTVARKTILGTASLNDSFPPGPGSDDRRAQVNAISCKQGLTINFRTCSVRNDPEGLGYGLITDGNR